LFSIFNKQMVTAKADGLSMTLWEMVGAFGILSLVLPLFTFFRGDAFFPVGADWIWLLVLSLLCTVWAFFLQLQALQFISAVTLNLSYNLEPVYGILLAFVFFRENQYLGAGFYYGMSLIAASVIVQMIRVRRGAH
jgi:drug/metabolite transporter (DMT)-like permease